MVYIGPYLLMSSHNSSFVRCWTHMFIKMPLSLRYTALHYNVSESTFARIHSREYTPACPIRLVCAFGNTSSQAGLEVYRRFIILCSSHYPQGEQNVNPKTRFMHLETSEAMNARIIQSQKFANFDFRSSSEPMDIFQLTISSQEQL